MKLHHIRSVGLLALGLLSISADGAKKEEIPFQDLGQSFIARNCPGAESELQCELKNLLAANYVNLTLGAFSIHYPASSLEDKKLARELGEIADGLLRLQETWLQWLNPADDDAEAALNDIAQVRQWIDDWNHKDLAKIAETEDKSLRAHLPGGAEMGETLDRIQAATVSSAVLGFEPRTTTVRIICCPTRRDFMEMVGYVGLLADPLRETFWVDGVDQWTQFWIDRTMILGLEYAPWGTYDPEFKKGRSMKKLEDTGLVEHVIQRSGTALFNFHFGRPEPRHVEEALALGIAIDICGQCNTLDGEGGITTSGATTQPYSRFVPGGNSAGGVLPAISAAPFNTIVENHWRKGRGKDHFVGALKKGQKAGAKRASKDKENPLRKNKLPHFELLDGNGGKFVVRAPFFGPLAKDQQYPPSEYLNDYREFFRSYKTAFVHWLRTKAAGEESAVKFAQAIQGMRDVGLEKTTLEALLEEAYGLPISGPDDESPSLEWGFLNWVATGK